MPKLTPPRISVIIPTLNRPSLLSEALASVADQEVSGEVEVVVVNDGERPLARSSRHGRAS